MVVFFSLFDSLVIFLIQEMQLFFVMQLCDRRPTLFWYDFVIASRMLICTVMGRAYPLYLNPYQSRKFQITA